MKNFILIAFLAFLAMWAIMSGSQKKEERFSNNPVLGGRTGGMQSQSQARQQRQQESRKELNNLLKQHSQWQWQAPLHTDATGRQSAILEVTSQGEIPIILRLAFGQDPADKTLRMRCEIHFPTDQIIASQAQANGTQNAYVALEFDDGKTYRATLESLANSRRQYHVLPTLQQESTNEPMALFDLLFASTSMRMHYTNMQQNTQNTYFDLAGFYQIRSALQTVFDAYAPDAMAVQSGG